MERFEDMDPLEARAFMWHLACVFVKASGADDPQATILELLESDPLMNETTDNPKEDQ